MSEPIKITVTREELQALIGYYAAQTGAAAPFRLLAGPAQPVTGVPAIAGATDGQGQIADAVKPALEVLVNAGSYGQLRFANGPVVFEHIVYFSADGTQTASLTTTPAGIAVEYPAQVTAVVDSLAYNLGTSPLRDVDIQLQLSTDEALTLAAMLDGQRRAILSALVTGQPVNPQVFGPRDICAAQAAAGQGAQWLVKLLAGVAAQGPLTETAAARALAGLEQQDAVIRQGGGYVLAPKTFSLAAGLLIIDNVIEVNAGYVRPDGLAVTADTLYVQAGVRSVLGLESADGQSVIRTAAAADILGHVREVFGRPDLLAEVEPPASQQAPPPPPPANRPRFCRNCGGELAGEAKFCTKCGTKL